jgi:carotenoid cleavage dioxygenase-like enzyme
MKSVYRLCAIGDDGTQKQVAAIPVSRPAYMHSFGMSADHLVLTEFPLVVNPINLRLSGEPFIRNYRWKPERGLVFHVVEKDSGRLVRTAKTHAAFAFHHVNAFADGAGLNVDAVVYRDAAIIDQLYLARLRASTPVTATGTLMRFHVPFASDAPVKRRALAALAFELPRINYDQCAGKPYRYVWGTGQKTRGDFLDSIVKIDTAGGESIIWFKSGFYPGEPVFVPAPSAKAEDDGVLLSIVLDIARDRSFLLVLDATSLQALARAEAPHAIPFHFHGNYFPN